MHKTQISKNSFIKKSKQWAVKSKNYQDPTRRKFVSSTLLPNHRVQRHQFAPEHENWENHQWTGQYDSLRRPGHIICTFYCRIFYI